MTYHFIITLAFAAGMRDFDGTYIVKPGMTRKDVYREIRAWAKQKVADEGDGASSVTSFSLEPNELPGGAQ